MRILVLLLLWTAMQAGDAEGMMGMFRPEVRPFTLGLSAQGEREPLREADGVGFASSTWRGGLTAQPYASDHDELQIGLRGGWHALESNAALPRTGALPEHLYESYASGSYRFVTPERRIYGASLQVGGAGDHVGRWDTTAFMVNAFMRLPSGADDGWIILLNAANNRTLLNYIPIPGVAYHVARGRELNALIGIPFMSVFWRPTAWSDLMAFGSPFGTAMMGAGVNPIPALPPLRLGISMEWVTESFRRAERIEKDDVLYLRETRLLGRLGVSGGPVFNVDLYGGWIFQREAREAESYSKAGDNRLELPPGPVFGMSGRCRF